jgi:uncharacterized membrane protein
MTIITLYLATAVVFLALDAVALTNLLRPLFERHIGDWLVDGFRIGPAVVFYLFYIGVLVYFVSWPAVRDGHSLGWVAVHAGLLGAFAYGTYEFTNYATLERWHWQMVAVDLTWGTILTATAASVGVVAARLVA